MKDISTRELGDIFTSAFHLNAKPIAVYGSDTVPEDAVHISSIHRCIAVTMFRIASQDTIHAGYLGHEAKQGCCPGGLTHLGFSQRPDYIRYFVSTGKKDAVDGSAEYLKSSPELVDACFSAMGRIRPPGKNLIIQTCKTISDTQHDVLSICCFGNAEQIRNLAALVHFDCHEPFFPVLVPWGPACATFISYPAGMAEKSPKGAAFMGPQDPTFNWAFPPDYLGIGLPIEVARKMGEDISHSFVIKRPKVAFPSHERIM